MDVFAYQHHHICEAGLAVKGVDQRFETCWVKVSTCGPGEAVRSIRTSARPSDVDSERSEE
eukprot:11146155-Alexandrium_andersonii.AAC.1